MNSGDFRLFVGLGNPGSKYFETRHNIGFMALEKLALEKGAQFHGKQKLLGKLATIRTGENNLRLLMPETYMNESGRSIRAALDWFDIKTEQLLVLVDDMDLPLGRLRFRSKGSAGGHNGLKSTINHLGTQEFSRLRIGIGSPSSIPEERRSKTISHVLGAFTKDEIPLVKEVLKEIITGLNILQCEGIERACTHINSYRHEECSSIQ